jgi:DNA-binding MarR family transcriptional regulator
MNLLHTIHYYGQIADADFEAAMSGYGLTARQALMLRAVADNPDCSQHVLVTKTGVDRSTASDIVKRLKAKGLIERARSKDDARRYEMRLTADGRKALSHAERAAKSVEQKLIKKVPSLAALDAAMGIKAA